MQPGFLDYYSTVLQLSSERAGLIANNIANADTPGYKATDIDFNAALQTQMSTPGSTAPVQYRTDSPVALSGNDVSLDNERIAAAQNGEIMASASTFLHQSTADLVMALRPNPSGN